MRLQRRQQIERQMRDKEMEKAGQQEVRKHVLRQFVVAGQYWHRTADKQAHKDIIDLLVSLHRPYKIINHGAGVKTISTVDVVGKCLCCGGKDSTLCRLAK